MNPIPETLVAPHEHVILYPTFGYAVNAGRDWCIPILGTIYNLETIGLRKRWLVRLLKRMLQVPDQTFDNAVFQQRLRCFASGAQSRRMITIRIGSRTYRLAGKTTRRGKFHGHVQVPVGEVAALQSAGLSAEGWLNLQLHLPAGDVRTFACSARLIAPSGMSVISDIDDTIKHTEIYDRQAALTNTFLREFRGIDGMADVYRRWQREGTVFHYVSGSPWQLFESLAEWMAREEFPAGSFHLRTYHLRSHLLRRLCLWFRTGKRRLAANVLRRFPERQFVLVGDSGDRDPEIYGALARRFREQIVAILIRDLQPRPLDDRRRRRAFRGLPTLSVTTFRSPAELPESLRSYVSIAGG